MLPVAELLLSAQLNYMQQLMVDFMVQKVRLFYIILPSYNNRMFQI